MSEYQYYEFLAIDKPLTKEQQARLRALSTRATITSTRFQNSYNYGDFKGDPEVLMESYFDAHVYVANWGTRWFMLSLPESLLDRETTSQYCACDALEVHLKNGFAILEFRSEDEERGEWEDGEGWVESLLPVRGELASGDLRALYLGWLLCAQYGYVDDDQIEPPVPPGLGALSEPLKSLAEFLWIDEDLIAVAAERSEPLRNDKPTRQEIEQWVVGLPESEKNSLLLRLVDGEAKLGEGLIQQLRRSRAQGVGAGPRKGTRTVAAIRAAAEVHAEERRQEEKSREREERIRLGSGARGCADQLSARAGRSGRASVATGGGTGGEEASAGIRPGHTACEGSARPSRRVSADRGFPNEAEPTSTEVRQQA